MHLRIISLPIHNLSFCNLMMASRVFLASSAFLLLLTFGTFVDVANGQCGTSWCTANPSADDPALQNILDWVCAQAGTDCTQIQPGGECYLPNTLSYHASVVMNQYYVSRGRTPAACYFSKSGLITITNPGNCF